LTREVIFVRVFDFTDSILKFDFKHVVTRAEWMG